MNKLGTYLLFFMLLFARLQAQKVQFKMGDAVTVSYAGDSYKGVIVGPYEKNEFGATYQVHLEGEKYCNNHVLDTRYNANFVFARAASNPQPAAPPAAPVAPPANPAPVHNSAPAGAHLPPTAVPAGVFKPGQTVLYAQTAIWNIGTVKGYDAANRRYTLQDVYVGIPCYAVAEPGRKYNNDFFVGNWEVYISGATHTFIKDRDLYRSFSSGAKLPPLQIKNDGTYLWQVAEQKSISGRWVPRNGVPGITLLKGMDGLDWTVYENTEAFAITPETRDEIRFHHLPSGTGYYMAYRIGPNKSCVLTGRTSKK